MFVAKDRPGAGSQNRRDRTIEDTTSPMEGHGSLRPFAERVQGRREARRVELNRGLRASEETLQGLIEASLQGVLIVTKECEPLLANQIFARIFGFESPAEIVALDSIAGLIASPALARPGAIGIESLDGSETPEIHQFEGVRWDGSIVRLKSMAKPVDWRGRRAVVLTLLEITGRGKAGAALSGREAQLGAIMDNAPAGIYLKDGDGRYPRINRRCEALWRVKDEEARGRLPGLGAIAAAVTERKHAEARGTIGLCQDGGQRAR